MVQELDPEQPAGLLDATRDRVILLARSGIPGRMIVGQDQARRGECDRGHEHLPRMDEARVEAPDRYDLAPEDLIPGVEVEPHKVLPAGSADVPCQLVDVLGPA